MSFSFSLFCFNDAANWLLHCCNMLSFENRPFKNQFRSLSLNILETWVPYNHKEYFVVRQLLSQQKFLHLPILRNYLRFQVLEEDINILPAGACSNDSNYINFKGSEVVLPLQWELTIALRFSLKNDSKVHSQMRKYLKLIFLCTKILILSWCLYSLYIYNSFICILL